MKSDAEKLYMDRKNGSKMGRSYIFSHYSPSLIVFLIVMTLSFVMVFISSMSSAIDRMIVLLGSGSIRTRVSVDVSDIKGARIDEVKEGDGIIYSENGKSLVHFKGVDLAKYFEGERGETLDLVTTSDSYKNEIIISSSLSESLSLSLGSSLTLLIYEKDNERARPVLMKVKGIYSSGYSQLDKYLSYVDISLSSDESNWEILLDKKTNIDEVLTNLWQRGIYAESYKDRYSSLCANVNQSIMILNVILIFVAILAAFFSADIAHVYISQDRKDIASLRLMGMEEKRVRKIYRLITLFSVFFSSLLGIIFGVLLSQFSPSLIKLIAQKEPELVEYYISSFTLSVPYKSLFLMLALMLVCSYITLSIELYRTRNEELSFEIKEE